MQPVERIKLIREILENKIKHSPIDKLYGIWAIVVECSICPYRLNCNHELCCKDNIKKYVNFGGKLDDNTTKQL